MNKFELFKNFNLELLELIRSLEKDLLKAHNKPKTADNNQNAQRSGENKKPAMWRLGHYIGSIGKNENILFLYKNRKNSLHNYSQFEEKLEQILENIKKNINFNLLENLNNEEVPDIIRKFKLNLNSLIAKYAANLQSDWDDEREEQIRATGHEDRSDDEIESLHKTGGDPTPKSLKSTTRTIPILSSEEEKIIEKFSKLDSESKIDTLIKAILFNYKKEEISPGSVSDLSIELSRSKDFSKGEGVFYSILSSLSNKEYEDYQNKLQSLDDSQL